MRWKGKSIVEPSFFVENRDFSGLETDTFFSESGDFLRSVVDSSLESVG